MKEAGKMPTFSKLAEDPPEARTILPKPSLEDLDDAAVSVDNSSRSQTESFDDEPLEPLQLAMTVDSANLITPACRRRQTPPTHEVSSVADTSSTVSLQPTPSFSFDDCETMRELFRKAYTYIQPGPLFRFVVQLYGERKLLVFFWIHVVSTLIIWAHFFLVKFDAQKDAVPQDDPFYWWKVLAPPLEFGAMHAILFQMALLPLTMCRFSIAALCDTILDRFVPLNRTLRMHIHLGYTMIVFVFLATLFFFAFFGHLCRGGEEEFCAKFTSEIMCTGYGILASLLIIGGTAYFRYRIPYEVFYLIHHLVFAMYVLTVIHTIDVEQRKGNKERSQTFKWFSSTLLYYICDRAAMHLIQTYRAPLVSSSTIIGSRDDSKMISLKLKRPVLFRFKPGQYAYLRLSAIDRHWHPFSIASGPGSDNLEFYIEVFGEGSWTGNLWNLLEGDGSGDDGLFSMDFEIMGPYGTSLAKTENYSHALAIGAGTGIVPILSLFQQHISQLERLAPDSHFESLKAHQKKMYEVELAEAARKGSVAQHVLGFCQAHKPMDEYKELQHKTRADQVKASIRSSLAKMEETPVSRRSRELRKNTRNMKQAAFQATRSMYGVVLLAGLPVLGIALIGVTISWNTIGIELYDGMVECLQAFSVLFQFCFAVVSLFVWDANQFFAYVDIAMCLVTPVADAFWFYQYTQNGVLRAADVVTYCLHTGYMTFRAWNMTVKPRHRSWQESVQNDGVRTLERLDVVWVTRCSSLVSKILPDIDEIWKGLVASWGEDYARAVCRISVYVTDKDLQAREHLRKEIASTLLYQTGCVQFRRPDFGRIIEDHTLDLICTRRNSYSLLAFCGSPKLAQHIHHCKIFYDMLTAITGNKKHQMEFVSESYGGQKPKKKSSGKGGAETDTKRRTTAYKKMRTGNV